MNINVDKLVDFLKKVKMTKSVELTDCALDFNSKGLTIIANTTNKLGQVRSHLDISHFEEYKALGIVGVTDMATFVNILNRFKKSLSLIKEGNVLTVSDADKSVEIELISEQFIERDLTEPKLEFTDNFSVSAEVLADIIADIKLNKDAVLTIALCPGKVTFKNSGKYKFKRELDREVKSTLEAGFGQSFIDAVAELEGTLQMYVRADYPIKIVEESEGCNITLFLAPYVEPNE